MIHQQSSDETSSTLLPSAHICNFLALFVPLLFLSSLLPAATRASLHYRSALKTFMEIDDALAAAAGAFSSGFSFADLAPGLGLAKAETFFARVEVFLFYLKWTFGKYTGWRLALLAVRAFLARPARRELMGVCLRRRSIWSLSFVCERSEERWLKIKKESFEPTITRPNSEPFEGPTKCALPSPPSSLA